MLRYLLMVGICAGFLTGGAKAEDIYEWKYDRADEGILRLKNTSHGDPYHDEFSLVCYRSGDLFVEAREVQLFNDVAGPHGNLEDMKTLTLETSYYRLEAPLEILSNGYTGWASARFTKGVALVEGVFGGFIVVRAVNQKPVAERLLQESDIAMVYPSPDWKKSEPFKKYCEGILPPIP